MRLVPSQILGCWPSRSQTSSKLMAKVLASCIFSSKSKVCASQILSLFAVFFICLSYSESRGLAGTPNRFHSVTFFPSSGGADSFGLFIMLVMLPLIDFLFFQPDSTALPTEPDDLFVRGWPWSCCGSRFILAKWHLFWLWLRSRLSSSGVKMEEETTLF